MNATSSTSSTASTEPLTPAPFDLKGTFYTVELSVLREQALSHLSSDVLYNTEQTELHKSETWRSLLQHCLDVERLLETPQGLLECFQGRAPCELVSGWIADALEALPDGHRLVLIVQKNGKHFLSLTDLDIEF